VTARTARSNPRCRNAEDCRNVWEVAARSPEQSSVTSTVR
jgi:hypothetical protein